MKQADRRLAIWLFNPYGPLPDEGWRDYSYVMIGTVLADAGHDVVWWTSTYSHHFKTFRSKGWEDRRLSSRFKICLVPTPGYKKNIGIGRLWRDAVFGWRAFHRAAKMAAPDVVITSEPPTMLGFAGVRLARKCGATLIYDQMDLWPELIVQSLPPRFRAVWQTLCWPIYRCRRAMFERLDGAMALARSYLDSITNELPPGRDIPTIVVYNGVDVSAFREKMKRPVPDDVSGPLRRRGLKAIFAGSLGPSYDIDAMIAAAERLARNADDLTLYIAGDGPERGRVEEAAGRCPNLVYLGKLSPDVLPSVYAQCDIGLSCYSAKSNVEMCDKFYDYTAAGLAIMNSLPGEVREWIDGSCLGLQYTPGDADSLYEALAQARANPEQLKIWKTKAWEIGMRFDRAVQHDRLPQWIETVVSHSTAASARQRGQAG